MLRKIKSNIIEGVNFGWLVEVIYMYHRWIKKDTKLLFVCVEATKTDSPHGSGKASHVIYYDNPLIDSMLNNFWPIVNSFNRSIIAFKIILYV